LIEAAWANSTMADIAAEITNSIDKGGRTTPTADLPMGGFKLTGLGAGTAPGHSVRYEQVAELSYAADGVMATLGTSGPVNVNTRIPQHLLIPSGVVTLTFTNPYASGTVTVWSLILQMGGTAYTVNWPASVKWAGGAAPTLSGINKMDILSFMSYDGGTTWYGQLIGKSFAP
jgi:hypothetical protein